MAGVVNRRNAQSFTDHASDNVSATGVSNANTTPGCRCSNKKRTAAAMEKYKRILEFDPKNLGAYLNYAALLEQTGNLDGAIEVIRAACAALPDNTTLPAINAPPR